MKTGFCSEGALIDLASGKVYANSPGLVLSKHPYTIKDELGKDVTGEIDEVQCAQEIVNKNGMVKNPPGIFLGKNKYHLIDFRDDKKIAYLKSE